MKRGTWGLTRKIAGYVLWASYEDQLRTTPLDRLSYDPIDPADPEIQAIARLDLAAACRGLNRLTPGQRASILHELGIEGTQLPASDALKMLRMRARRALRRYIERGGIFAGQLKPSLQDAWRYVWPHGGGVASGHETTVLAGLTLVILLLGQTPSIPPEDRRDPPMRVPEAAVDEPVHAARGDAPTTNGGVEERAHVWFERNAGIAEKKARPDKRSGFNLAQPLSGLTQSPQARTLAGGLQTTQEQGGLPLATAITGDLARSKIGKLKRKLRARVGLRSSKL